MKVVILAGGRGTRLGGDQPKPMVEIGGIPMLSHIMGIYKKYGYCDFVIATGYKGETIRDYYKHDSNVTCLDTGLDSGTGERVRACYEYIGKRRFFLTYGDAVSAVNIDSLLLVHEIASANKFGKVTITSVHPAARFGQVVLDGNDVTQFNEKPIDQTEWINGGFFVVDDAPLCKSFEFDYLSTLAKEHQLRAYRHTGFWQCMDTQRDVDYLNQLWKDGAPWL